jgi:hypothetical protein
VQEKISWKLKNSSKSIEVSMSKTELVVKVKLTCVTKSVSFHKFVNLVLEFAFNGLYFLQVLKQRTNKIPNKNNNT